MVCGPLFPSRINYLGYGWLLQLEGTMARVPITAATGVKKFFCGPESFTPDLQPVVGEAPELDNFFVAAGLNSIGILTGGGLGRVMAHWVMTGRPDVDVTGFNIDRLHAYQANPEYRRTRTVESLGMVYQCHYPTRSMQTARGVKRSAIYDRLAARGAYFKDVSGWEGADWYAGPRGTPDPGPLTWGRPAFWSQWEAEHRACREGVKAMGLELFSPDDDTSAVVTTVRVPEIVDGERLLLDLRDRFGITFAPGQGPFKGKVFRIGHIGYFDVFDITTALAAIELALAEAGADIERGVAVTRALETYEHAPA